MATKIKAIKQEIIDYGCEVTIPAKTSEGKLVPTIIWDKNTVEKLLTDVISSDSELTFNEVVVGNVKTQTIAKFLVDTNNFLEE